MRRSRVSVVIPTKNRSPQLREALTSVCALSGNDLDLEVIVVDNGSTDDSEAVAAAFGARFVRNSLPGAAQSRNVGMHLATGEFLAFLDDDDVFLPEHIRPHIREMQLHPEWSAVVGQIIVTDYDFHNRTAPYPLAMPPDGNVLASFLNQYPQVGATLVRTSVRDTVGDFDPDLEGDEDWDWHLRIALRHQVGFVPVPCMLFRQRPVGATPEVEWRRVRNTRRVFFKNVRRAGRARPAARALALMFLRHNGRYHAYFAEHALMEARTHHIAAALIALRRAVLASPVHVLINMFRPNKFWPATAALVCALFKLSDGHSATRPRVGRSASP